MIFCGGGGNEILTYNLDDKKLTKMEFKSKLDRYCFNTVTMIKGKVYVMGYEGDLIHVYDTKAKTYEEIKFMGLLK